MNCRIAGFCDKFWPLSGGCFFKMPFLIYKDVFCEIFVGLKGGFWPSVKDKKEVETGDSVPKLSLFVIGRAPKMHGESSIMLLSFEAIFQ